jgi:hypothetical protein
MAGREYYVKSLKEYYKKQKISVNAFDCKYKDKCKDSVCRGSEAHVWTNYGEPFKVLIASLDRGKGAESIENRTKEIEGLKVLNPHMKGTLETLKVIHFFGVKVQEDVELFRYFAMINTAKCCIGRNMNQAPWQFFDNCKEYTKAEVEILAPDIIITQGENAAKVFELLYPELKNKDKWHERKGEILINHKALVICSIHPYTRNNWQRNTWQSFISKRLPKIIEEWKEK